MLINIQNATEEDCDAEDAKINNIDQLLDDEKSVSDKSKHIKVKQDKKKIKFENDVNIS